MSDHTPTKLSHRQVIQRRRRRQWAWILALALAAAAALVFQWQADRRWASTDDAFIAGHLIKLEAISEGTVVEILAENTQRVEQGQLLVRLDGRRAEIAWRQAEDELAAAVRQIAALQARRATLRQRVAARTAAAETLHHDLARLRKAAPDGAVSEQQLQNAEDRQRELAAALAEARAEQSELEAQLRSDAVADHPAVLGAAQRLRRAYLDYRRRNILAPATGYVARRKIAVGDHVTPGTPLLAIVPLDQVWVEANLLETEIAGVRPGQSAEIRVDAYPNRLYHGQVEGLSPGTGSQFALLPTDNATGNFIHIAERLPVRISLDPRELAEYPLQPGLSTVTRINVSGGDTHPLRSLAETGYPAYRSEIFDHELDELEPRIAQIIEANAR